MSAKKLTDIASIAIAASLVLAVTMQVRPPEHAYLLAYPEDGRDSYDDGYDRGYKDGQNHPINEQIRDGESGYNQEYRSGYLDGFLDGCLSVEGNDEDICNPAMDA